MRYYVNKTNGRIADMLQIQKHDNIVLQTYEFFNPNNDTDVKNVWDRIEKVEKGNICLYGFYNRGKGQEQGDFWFTVLLSRTFEEFKQDLLEMIEYKRL